MPFFDHYPYTNFHNVNLDWVLQAVKSWGALVEQNNQNFINLEAANESFKNYITTYLSNYFDNLDVQDEINNKLDQMLRSGVLTPYMQPYIVSGVNDWLSHNMTTTSPPVDATLSIRGAAADAYVTGQRVANIATVEADVAELNQFKEDITTLLNTGEYVTDLPVAWEPKSWDYSVAVGGVVTKKELNNGYMRIAEPVYINTGSKLTALHTNLRLVQVNNPTDMVMVRRFTISANNYYYFPSGGWYVMDHSGDTNPPRYYYQFEIANDFIHPVPDVNFAAMGDSITQGYYSYYENNVPTSASNTLYSYVTHLGEMTGWSFTNLGVGGRGYLYKTGDTYAGTGAYVALNTDFSSYDMVTVMYGINDWKGNAAALGDVDSPLGYMDNGTYVPPTTVAGAVKTVIEGITASNPKCKIVIISPLQCAGYYNSGTGRYDYESSPRMSLTYAMSRTGTLLQFHDMIKSICEYYGVTFLDLTLSGPVNFLNVKTMCPDGIHPSQDTHELIAQQLVKMIPMP